MSSSYQPPFSTIYNIIIALCMPVSLSTSPQSYQASSIIPFRSNSFAHLQAGCLVTVPFGNQTVQGIIVQLLDSPSVENPKPIIDLLDPAPVLTPPQLALAILLAESTLNPLASIVNLMLPTGLSQQADIHITNYEIHQLRR